MQIKQLSTNRQHFYQDSFHQQLVKLSTMIGYFIVAELLAYAAA